VCGPGRFIRTLNEEASSWTVAGAMDTALTPIGIPTFTAPFVFATWLFLLPKENFAPIPHEQVGPFSVV
jgi:urea transporter